MKHTEQTESYGRDRTEQTEQNGPERLRWNKRTRMKTEKTESYETDRTVSKICTTRQNRQNLRNKAEQNQ